jgi:hypothetical protein
MTTHKNPDDHSDQPPASDGSGTGVGGKNVPGHSVSHVGHQPSEDNPPSDASGSGTGGKNQPGKTLSGPRPQGTAPTPEDDAGT